MTTNLQLENISLSLAETPLLKSVTTSLNTGELVALVGPNGAGKTTLLKAALGQLDLDAGQVTLDQKPSRDYTPSERAKLISYLPQIRSLAWPLRVQDVVALGRFAYGGSTSKLMGKDIAYVETALQQCNINHLKDRHTNTLSGGELARMHCARAFAADTPLLLADEPVAALDPFHQLNIMSLFRNYVDAGKGALVILHDISLAARFADRLIWMKNGEIQHDGSVQDTFNAKTMKEIFDVDARIIYTDEIPSMTIMSPNKPSDL